MQFHTRSIILTSIVSFCVGTLNGRRVDLPSLLISGSRVCISAVPISLSQPCMTIEQPRWHPHTNSNPRRFCRRYWLVTLSPLTNGYALRSACHWLASSPGLLYHPPCRERETNSSAAPCKNRSAVKYSNTTILV
jgi:hypothetical protein